VVRVAGSFWVFGVVEKGAAMSVNFLIISSDQHRYDCVGVNGHPLLKTPNLDRLKPPISTAWPPKESASRTPIAQSPSASRAGRRF